MDSNFKGVGMETKKFQLTIQWPNSVFRRIFEIQPYRLQTHRLIRNSLDDPFLFQDWNFGQMSHNEDPEHKTVEIT